jgi:hypothetical protein
MFHCFGSRDGAQWNWRFRNEPRFRGTVAPTHCYVPTGRTTQPSWRFREKATPQRALARLWLIEALRPFVSRSRSLVERIGDFPADCMFALGGDPSESVGPTFSPVGCKSVSKSLALNCHDPRLIAFTWIGVA